MIHSANAMARLTRATNQDYADLARKWARPGEPHAKRRAIYRGVSREVNRRVERTLLYGEDAA